MPCWVPIAMGGENYRRSSPNVTVYDTHTRFAEPTADGRYTLRTDAGARGWPFAPPPLRSSA